MAIRKSSTLSAGTHYDAIDSPVGKLTLITGVAGLHAILWDREYESPYWQNTLPQLQHSPEEKTIMNTKKQLGEYFQGERKVFDLPLILNGTEFQVLAWNALISIPYASTISYAEQAAKFAGRNKARAVGMANGRNPIPIVIPCHRVIGSNGKLVGFGGGMDKKIYLLDLERQYCLRNP